MTNTKEKEENSENIELDMGPSLIQESNKSFNSNFSKNKSNRQKNLAN